MKERGEMRGEIFTPLSLEVKEISPAIDESSSFMLLDEKNEKGKNIPAEIAWIKLIDGGRSIEGKIYIPTNGQNELVIINPGLPGDGVVRFEDVYVEEMVKQGYTVFSSRHNGLKVEKDSPDKYIHCPEKKNWANSNHQNIIGEKFSFDVLSREVLVAIKGLESDFNRLHFVGHSAGSLNILNSLVHLSNEYPGLKKKIGNFVSMAGVVENYDKELMREILNWIQEEKNILDSIDIDTNLQQFEECEKRLKEIDWSQFPNMSSMFVTPTNFLKGKPDEYVAPESVDNFANFMKEQGCPRVRVVSYANRNIPDGKESHDFDHFSPGIAMRWINGETIEKLTNSEK